MLGPGLNIKRSPLCGRNFEYLSEDPLVSGEMAAALTQGIQSRGVGASLKHFAANNQEHDRMRSSSDVDARPLREIYLRGFERAVKQAQPWTVMSAYNRINGVSASENRWLLTEVLREDWGFEGLVVSDWFAVADRAEALQAGLDLEMPTTGGVSQQRVLEAVRSGKLEEKALDDCAERVIQLIQQVLRGAETGAEADDAGTPASAEAAASAGAHHELAREAAARSAVLLKNEDQLLPLNPQSSVAVIGEFARRPRFQGAGSSQINPIRVEDAYSAIAEAAEGPVSFAPGFILPWGGARRREQPRGIRPSPAPQGCRGGGVQRRRRRRLPGAARGGGVRGLRPGAPRSSCRTAEAAGCGAHRESQHRGGALPWRRRGAALRPPRSGHPGCLAAGPGRRFGHS